MHGGISNDLVGTVFRSISLIKCFGKMSEYSISPLTDVPSPISNMHFLSLFLLYFAFFIR